MKVKLAVKNWSVFCGDKLILQDINMEIQEKKITALIGPSGCGKSTLLKSLNRMNEEEFPMQKKGEILLDGEDIYHWKVNKSILRKKVGMIFQQPNPFPMNIYENVAYGPKIHGIRRKDKLDSIVELSLKQAGIWEEIGRNPYLGTDRLSGGQKQRVCIARALAVEPEVLLLDEPTSALDPKATEKMEELFLELRQTKTIVIVTHNLKQAERIADETAFFMKGQLIENRITSLLFSCPQKKETKNYLKTFI